MMIQEHKKAAEESDLSEEEEIEDMVTEKVNLFNNIDAQM